MMSDSIVVDDRNNKNIMYLFHLYISILLVFLNWSCLKPVVEAAVQVDFN